MKKFLKYYLSFLVLLTLFLLVAHSIKIKFIFIDNTTILLILILCLLPFLLIIKKLKWGDLEADISYEEVKKIQETYPLTEEIIGEEVETEIEEAIEELEKEKIKAVSIENYTREDIQKLRIYLFDLIEVDPQLAIAKFRIEAENLIRALYLKFNTSNSTQYASIKRMLSELIDKYKIDYSEENYLKSLREIIDVCNRVIHGEKIDYRTAFEVLRTGIVSLGYMVGYLSTTKRK